MTVSVSGEFDDAAAYALRDILSDPATHVPTILADHPGVNGRRISVLREAHDYIIGRKLGASATRSPGDAARLIGRLAGVDQALASTLYWHSVLAPFLASIPSSRARNAVLGNVKRGHLLTWASAVPLAVGERSRRHQTGRQGRCPHRSGHISGSLRRDSAVGESIRGAGHRTDVPRGGLDTRGCRRTMVSATGWGEPARRRCDPAERRPARPRPVAGRRTEMTSAHPVGWALDQGGVRMLPRAGPRPPTRPAHPRRSTAGYAIPWRYWGRAAVRIGPRH